MIVEMCTDQVPPTMSCFFWLSTLWKDLILGGLWRNTNIHNTSLRVSLQLAPNETRDSRRLFKVVLLMFCCLRSMRNALTISFHSHSLIRSVCSGKIKPTTNKSIPPLILDLIKGIWEFDWYWLCLSILSFISDLSHWSRLENRQTNSTFCLFSPQWHLVFFLVWMLF